MLSDSNRNKHDIERRLMKRNFMRKEDLQLKNYIKDLEHNLSLNKGIIADLVKNNIKDEHYKKIIEKLNVENENLHLQLKTIIKERDDAQANLLIANQIEENNKKHKTEEIKTLKEINEDLLDQLNRKEYSIQRIEQKYQTALEVMRGLVHKEPEVTRFLSELRMNDNIEIKITNVIDANNILKTELDIEKETNQRLAVQMLENGLEPCVPLRNMNHHMCSSIKDMKTEVISKPKLTEERKQKEGNKLVIRNEKKNKQEEPNDDFNFVIHEKPSLKIEKIENNKIKELKDKIKELYEINKKLSEALRKLEIQ